MADRPTLTIYSLYPNTRDIQIVPGSSNLPWMSRTPDRAGHRCLPLRMANQAGWLVLNDTPARVQWDGGTRQDAIRIEADNSQSMTRPAIQPISNFGGGIVTWRMPYLFRTSPGFNLLVRGPANHVKDGAGPLEGLVETDWCPAPFTFSYQITRPNVWIEFGAGEPLFMVVPQRRSDLELFQTETRSIDEDPGLQRESEAWRQSRVEAMTAGIEKESAAEKPSQMAYQKNGVPNGASCSEHQVQLKLQPFASQQQGGHTP